MEQAEGRHTLGEASLLAQDGELVYELGHMTTEQLARGALKARPGLLIATHLWPGLTAPYSCRKYSQYIRPGCFSLC